MKTLSIVTAALIAVAGVASAQSVPMLSSAVEVTLSTLAPSLDTAALSSIQISELNRAVGSSKGLNQTELSTILRN